MESSLLPPRTVPEQAEGTPRDCEPPAVLPWASLTGRTPELRTDLARFLPQKGRKLAVRNYGSVHFRTHRADHQKCYL